MDGPRKAPVFITVDAVLPCRLLGYQHGPPGVRKPELVVTLVPRAPFSR